MSDAPKLLVIAAFWADSDVGAEVSAALQRFKTADEYKGAVVTFAPEQADEWSFQQTMRRLQLDEANFRPPA